MNRVNFVSVEYLLEENLRLRMENAELRSQLKCREIEGIDMTLEELEDSYREYFSEYNNEVVRV